MFARTGSDSFPSYLKSMITGSPKSGKTTFLGTVPNILILDTEPDANNLQSVAHLDLPYKTIRSTDDLRQALFVLGNDGYRQQAANQLGMPSIDAVAIDTVDTLQGIMKKERMREQRSTQFLRDDWNWLGEEMTSLVQAFTALPMHVFFLVHTKTENVGSEENPRNVVLPGLQGAIASKIAGMVGYSLHAFRKEEIKPDGSGKYTKYWLKAEGDETYEYLGTRVGGINKLPHIIEPDFKTIFDAAMKNRPTTQRGQVTVDLTGSTNGAAPAGQPAAQPPVQTDVQNAGQPDQQQEAAQNAGQPEAQQPPAEQPSAPPASAQQPAAAGGPQQTGTPAMPDANEPINAQGLSYVKRVFDGLELDMPEAKIGQLNLGQARDLVKTWKALQQDEAEQKLGGQSAAQVMTEYLGNLDLLPGAGDAPAPEKTVEPKVDGTIDEVKAYAVDLVKVQEAYDLETAKASPRKSLVTWLEAQGAKPAAPPTEPPASVQTDVQTGGQPEQAVTPDTPAADASITEEQGVQNVKDGLGAQEVVDPAAGDKCEVCGGELDDEDIANLGLVRFKKKLCVQDYLAATKASKTA